MSSGGKILIKMIGRDRSAMAAVSGSFEAAFLTRLKVIITHQAGDPVASRDDTILQEIGMHAWASISLPRQAKTRADMGKKHHVLALAFTNTVRKVLRSGETSFSYKREVQPRPKLGRWKTELDRLLSLNAKCAARERLTLSRIFEELQALGYESGYDAVRRYARSWTQEHASQMADAYVPLSFAPGEAYQFDWSHEIVVMNGVTVTVKVAHVGLCHSRMMFVMFVRAYPRETQEMVFDAHERAFAQAVASSCLATGVNLSDLVLAEPGNRVMPAIGRIGEAL